MNTEYAVHLFSLEHLDCKTMVLGFISVKELVSCIAVCKSARVVCSHALKHRTEVVVDHPEVAVSISLACQVRTCANLKSLTYCGGRWYLDASVSAIIKNNKKLRKLDLRKASPDMVKNLPTSVTSALQIHDLTISQGGFRHMDSTSRVLLEKLGKQLKRLELHAHWSEWESIGKLCPNLEHVGYFTSYRNPNRPLFLRPLIQQCQHISSIYWNVSAESVPETRWLADEKLSSLGMVFPYRAGVPIGNYFRLKNYPNITNLNLSKYHGSFAPVASIFNNLKKLEIRMSTISKELMEILRSCPVEELKICCSRGFDMLEPLADMTGREYLLRLTKLHIEVPKGVSRGDLKRLLLMCPKLKYLTVHDNFGIFDILHLNAVADVCRILRVLDVCGCKCITLGDIRRAMKHYHMRLLQELYLNSGLFEKHFVRSMGLHQHRRIPEIFWKQPPKLYDWNEGYYYLAQ